jgi:hypothetical protein
MAPHLGVDVEIVIKDPQVKGFSVVKRRWVVERTLGCSCTTAACPETTKHAPPTPPA